MELYDVKARGLRYPLNAAEISHLFRSGYLHRRVRCKPEGVAQWSTIGELFPLLEYNFSNYSLPSDDANRRWRRLGLPLLAIVVAAGAYVCWGRSNRGSVNSNSVAQSASHQVDAAIVVARSN